MMCCKKWVGGLAALVAAVVGVGVLGGTDAGRWATGTVWVQIQKAWELTQKQVSPEDEIKRIENEVANLNQDIDAQYDKYVHMKKDIERLEKDVAEQKLKVDGQWVAIQRLKSDLDKAVSEGRDYVTYEGKRSDLSVVRSEVTDRWDAFKKGKDGLEKKEKMLDEKRSLLVSMNENMKQLAQTQSDLKLKLEDLKVKLEQARVAEAKNQSSTVSDGWKTRLSHIQDSMAKVEDHIDYMSQVAKEQGNRPATGRDVRVDQTIKADNALDEIRKYEDNLNKVASDK